MLTDIKRCPICGGAEIRVQEVTMFRWRRAFCDACGAMWEAPAERKEAIDAATSQEGK
jgi:uncharacterized Zn finger protein